MINSYRNELFHDNKTYLLLKSMLLFVNSGQLSFPLLELLDVGILYYDSVKVKMQQRDLPVISLLPHIWLNFELWQTCRNFVVNVHKDVAVILENHYFYQMLFLWMCPRLRRRALRLVNVRKDAAMILENHSFTKSCSLWICSRLGRRALRMV